jgi:hypothetical protein
VSEETTLESDGSKLSPKEKLLRRLDAEAYQTGCSGLQSRWAKNPTNGKRFHADHCTKGDGLFMCESCFSDAIHKHCAQKIHHFAHQARHSPAVGKFESALHRNCKTEILAALQQLYPYPLGKWEMERQFKANPEKKLKARRPDLSGYVGSIRVIIEIQASALTIPQIVSRMKDYTQRQCFVLWIVPLTDDLGCEPFLPRLYERYFHSIYFGRTYYWRPGDGATFRPVHYGMASRWIDERQWYDVEEGEEKSGGGYYRPYVIVKTPIAGTPVELSLTLFKAVWRSEFLPWNARKKVPRCKILRDRQHEWWSDAEEMKQQPDYYNYLQSS